LTEIESCLQNEIKNIFCIQKNEIKEFNNLRSSNYVYSFVLKKQKYVIHKLNDESMINWEQEKAAYNALKPLNITDELVYYENGIRVTKFLDNSKTLSFGESDMIDALDSIRKVHESGASIKYNYNILENMEKYISRYNQKSMKLNEFKKYRNKIDAIQAMIGKLNIPPVLCHGDACASTNFLRLPDATIRIIDWEQAGMADPLLDIAIATLHQGFKNVDPVWCLHQYLKRTPEKTEYLRLFSYLALDSYALMAWYMFENPRYYGYYLKSAVKYGDLVLNYYR
jgi:thiamine kinase-like enzyme